MRLQKCVSSRKELYEYNLKHGDENYIDPLTQLLCVQFDNSPNVGDYWMQKTSLGNDEK